MFGSLEPNPAEPQGATPTDVDRLVDDLYRAALCLTFEPAAAGALVEQAVEEAIGAGEVTRWHPALRPALRALARCAAALPEPADGDGSVLAGDAEADRALAAFRFLPADVRLPAALYFTQPLTSRQVAEVLEAPLESVRARLSLARRLLRDVMVEA